MGKSTIFLEPQYLSGKRKSNRCRLDTFACQFECGAYREHRRKLDMTAGCFKLRTTIPLPIAIGTVLTLTLQKEKSPERVSVRASTEGQKAKSIQLPLNAFCFLWRISDSNRSPQHCQRCALAR